MSIFNTAQETEWAEKAKKSRNLRRRIFIVVFLVLILLIFVVAWSSGKRKAEQKAEEEITELKSALEQQEEHIQELIDTPITVSQVNPEIVLDLIHSEINELGELASMEYLFTDAAEFSDSQQIMNWNIPFTEKSFILRWDGIIKAGVKLELVSIEVKEEEKKIIVSVPAAEILSYQVDSSSVEVLYEKDNIFNNITVDDKIQFDAATEEAMIQRAIENGILEKAQSNAEDILYRLLTTNPAISVDYTIEFSVNRP